MTRTRLGAVTALAALALAGVIAVRVRPPGAPGFLRGDDEAGRRDREITRQFGMEHPVVWIVEGRAGTVWSPAVLERIDGLTRAVFAVPGVIAPDVVSLASPNVRDVRVTDGGLTPVYLMGAIPRDPAAVRALREQVEHDPLLRGNLVSLDGRAALVVANFRPEADADAIGAAALALRQRFQDDVTRVWVVGAPVLRLTARESVLRVLPRLAGVLFVLVGAGGLLLGMRRTAAAIVAAAAAALATAGVGAAGGGTLAWTMLAGLTSATVAAALAAEPSLSPPPRVLLLALGMALATSIFAALTDPALRLFAAATAAGIPIAATTALAARAALAVVPRADGSRWPRHVVALLVLGVALGATRSFVSLDGFGYGLRYLPSPARDDLAALARHFPPPTSFTVRVHGEPGFVARPAVLGAFERLTDALRRDAAVTSATSLADLVKRVHRTFNEERVEFERIPDDAGLVGRYLALAYSPGFRRFVDRPLATSALWVSVRQPVIADVARVHATLRHALRTNPIPGATADPPSGDGVALLAQAGLAAALARGALGVLILTASAFLTVIGTARARRALVTSAASLAVATGLLGWLGLALDLVTLPALFAVGLAALLASAARAGA